MKKRYRLNDWSNCVDLGGFDTLEEVMEAANKYNEKMNGDWCSELLELNVKTGNYNVISF